MIAFAVFVLGQALVPPGAALVAGAATGVALWLILKPKSQ
jgi:hypothetical protein